jgi:hypothetical protein
LGGGGGGAGRTVAGRPGDADFGTTGSGTGICIGIGDGTGAGAGDTSAVESGITSIVGARGATGMSVAGKTLVASAGGSARSPPSPADRISGGMSIVIVSCVAIGGGAEAGFATNGSGAAGVMGRNGKCAPVCEVSALRRGVESMPWNGSATDGLVGLPT